MPEASSKKAVQEFPADDLRARLLKFDGNSPSALSLDAYIRARRDLVSHLYGMACCSAEASKGDLQAAAAFRR